MAVYDSTDHQLGDYLLGQATGYSTSAWGSLGAQEYRRQQAHRDASFQIGRRPPNGSAGSVASSGVFDAAGEFGSEWTETISEFVASTFSWIPNCFGWIFKLIGVVAFFAGGVHYEFTGFALVAIAASGWLRRSSKARSSSRSASHWLSLTSASWLPCLF